MLAEKLKLVKPGEIRTRFAPSPTGFFHVGGARTALFNYLFAQKNKGIFVLRIEDTDKKRSLAEFEENILESLKWLGIEWNEFYRQSERINIYKQYLEKLLKENKAYYCFCSESELESQKQYQMSQGIAPHYTGKCTDLDEKTVNKCLAEKKPAVIRFRTKAKKIVFTDLIRGKLEFDTNLMGDMVIAKNLNTPLYNFAVAVDDYEMKINYIIRGEEHISNTPRQILIQEALDFNQPFYAHLPLILAPDKTKLSKRHGANSITDFQEQGYLPETLINFMALLGWSAGQETKEIYSLASLVKEFSLEKIQKSGAVFNIKKLDFLNGFYLRQKSIDKLTELCLPYLIEANLIIPQFKTEQYPPAYGAKEIKQIYKNSETNKEISFDYLKKIILIYQERLKKLSEISELIDFFFKKDFFSDKDLLKWKEMSDKEIKNSLNLSKKILDKVKQEDWVKENLENLLMFEAGKKEDRGELLWPLRAALTGKQSSAGPFEIAEILGKQETLKRIDNALKQL